MKHVVIASAARTPIGKLGGSLASLSSVDLGTYATKAAIKRAGLDPHDVDQVIMGNVLQAGSGQNVARQIALRSGLLTSSCAMTINEVCGSGLKALRLAQAAIVMGEAQIVVAGGTESMSNVPFYAPDMRFGHHYGDTSLVDGLTRDGLQDAFTGNSMALTAENVAAKFAITRAQQDSFALASHRKAVQAWNAHEFDTEIVPIPLSDGTVVERDEHPRANTSMERLSALRTLFQPQQISHQTNPTVTAGNASGINDGASALVVMDKQVAIDKNIDYLAEIVGFAEGGIDPDFMGYAPKHVMERMMKQTGFHVEDIDLFEINEAFAAQSIAVCQQLHIPLDKVNIRGGAIALGHPLGASGARIVTTLLHALADRQARHGVAALCVGGGIGVAMQFMMNTAIYNS